MGTHKDKKKEKKEEKKEEKKVEKKEKKAKEPRPKEVVDDEDTEETEAEEKKEEKKKPPSPPSSSGSSEDSEETVTVSAVEKPSAADPAKSPCEEEAHRLRSKALASLHQQRPAEPKNEPPRKPSSLPEPKNEPPQKPSSLPSVSPAATVARRRRTDRGARKAKASYQCQRCHGTIVPSAQAWRGHRRGARCLSWRAWNEGTRPWSKCLQEGERLRKEWEAGRMADSPEPEDLYGSEAASAGAKQPVQLRSARPSLRRRMDSRSRSRTRRSSRRSKQGRSEEKRRSRRRRRQSTPPPDRTPDFTKYPGGPKGGPPGGGGLDKGRVLTALFQEAARALQSW